MADALDLGSSSLTGVGVQVPPRAPTLFTACKKKNLFVWFKQIMAINLLSKKEFENVDKIRYFLHHR